MNSPTLTEGTMENLSEGRADILIMSLANEPHKPDYGTDFNFQLYIDSEYVGEYVLYTDALEAAIAIVNY